MLGCHSIIQINEKTIRQMKNVKFASVLVMTALSLSMSSCDVLQQTVDPKNAVQETFDVKNFDGLEIGNAFEITVTKGNDFKIKASGDSRDIDDLVVKERNGTLEVYYRNNWRLRRYKMNIEIEMPTLKEVDFSGATEASVKGFDNLSDLEIDLSGASKATFITNAKTYDIDLSGASTLELEGKTDKIYAELSGASTLNAFSTDATNVSLNLSGASNSRVNVAQQLKVTASGTSKVRYRGAAKVESDLSGSSKVVKE
jgi:hypothetical protein